MGRMYVESWLGGGVLVMSGLELWPPDHLYGVSFTDHGDWKAGWHMPNSHRSEFSIGGFLAFTC